MGIALQGFQKGSLLNTLPMSVALSAFISSSLPEHLSRSIALDVEKQGLTAGSTRQDTETQDAEDNQSPSRLVPGSHSRQQTGMTQPGLVNLDNRRPLPHPDGFEDIVLGPEE